MARFVYVNGDASKTPVDPTQQPNGTILVQVTDSGREVRFTAQTNAPAKPAPAAATKAEPAKAADPKPAG